MKPSSVALCVVLAFVSVVVPVELTFASAAVPAYYLQIDTIPSPEIAGVPFPVRITARDVNGTLVPVNGTVVLALSWGGIQPNSVQLVNGVWNGSVRTIQAQRDAYINATAFGETFSSNRFDITANRIDRFAVAISPQVPTAGKPVDLLVVAKDAYNNTVEDFTGGVVLNLSTTSNVNLSNKTFYFTDLDNGTLLLHAAIVFFAVTPQSNVLSVTAQSDNSIRGFVRNITVATDQPYRMVKLAGDGQYVQVGRLASPFEVQLLDQYNNSIPNAAIDWVIQSPPSNQGLALSANVTETNSMGRSENTLRLGEPDVDYVVVAYPASQPPVEVQFVVHAIPSPDFNLFLGESSGFIYKGLAHSVLISIVPLGAYNTPVSLSAENLPAGLEVNFTEPASKPPYQAVMTFTASDFAPSGKYEITIVAKSIDGSLQRTVTYTLTINEVPYALVVLVAAASFLLGLIVSEPFRDKNYKSITQLVGGLGQSGVTSLLLLTGTGAVSKLLAAEIFTLQFIIYYLGILLPQNNRKLRESLSALWLKAKNPSGSSGRHVRA
jgi:hypothetical protein